MSARVAEQHASGACPRRSDSRANATQIPTVICTPVQRLASS
jgi:hypothetical protein